jgi:A/G-specific adenine glycosylase
MNPLSEKLLPWYAAHGRKSLWEGQAPGPYEVWVAVIMLQQTRLETVIPYLQRWLERFPTVFKLAKASEEEVLFVWEGLGYYSRARNLHKAARIVVEQLGGELPRDLAELQRLPGIGRYAAGAIGSIALGLDAAALDGNLKRVFARVFDVTEPADSPAGEAILWRLAEENLPLGQAGAYNQALMDLGATVCIPRKPLCLICPLQDLCLARQLGIQEQRPVLKARTKGPHYTVTAAVLQRDDKVLLAKRPSKGLLGGMWEFPGGKVEPGESLPNCLAREIREELGVAIRVEETFGQYEHAYSHFSITLHAFCCTLMDGEPRPIQAAELAWVSITDLKRYPMGKVDRQIARNLQA